MKLIRCVFIFVLAKSVKCDEDELCSIYLAPTSIKGAISLGVFTTKSFEKGDIILPADGPNIPVADPFEKEGQWTDLFMRYWWEHGGMDDVMREANHGLDYQITFGALPNHHSKLASVDARLPTPHYDDSMMNRKKDPGAGAFSYYLGRDFTAERKVEAGEELFLDYGQANWPGGENVPLGPEYDAAGELICNFLRKSSSSNHTGKFDDILLAAKSLDPLAASTLPKTSEEFDSVAKHLSSSGCQNPGYYLAKELSVEKRSIEWIRENGVCLDNIVPGPSTIPQAGRGAFARRNLVEGDLIVPVPFLHVTDSDSALTYSVFDGEEGEDVLHEQTQLLLNYCFGHHESSLLLCPETSAVLVNHCSKRLRQCGEQGPNAEYRWASGWDPDTEVWKKMTLDEMREHWSRGLSFEIFATRDIQKGEEIFIDYGEGWEKAWQEHVQNWKPPQRKGPFDQVFSTKLLNEKAAIPPEFEADDYRDDIWPSEHVGTDCVYLKDEELEIEMAGVWVLTRMKSFRRHGSEDRWHEELSDDEIMDIYSIVGDSFKIRGDPTDGDWFWPCLIMGEEDNEGDEEELFYTVRVFQSRYHESAWWDEIDVPRFVVNLPKTSIRFIHEPYKSDMHLPGAFRHFIEIHDEMFPEHWRDMKDGSQTSPNPEL